MNRLGTIFLLAVGLALPGCLPEETGGIVASKPSGPKASAPGVGKPPRLPEVIRMDILYVEVPAGQASGSEEIWSYLDEEPVGAERLASLGRNGIRVGLGRSGSDADIVRVLKRITGQSLGRRVMVGRRGTPHHVVLKRGMGVQTVFGFHADRTLSGSDMPPGDNVLTVVCTVDEDNAGRIILTGMPQVRSSRIKTHFLNEPAGVRILNRPVMFGFEDMMFQMPMAPGEFLVIGPGAASRRPHSVGRYFFIRKKQGVDFEVVLVLTPRAEMLPEKHR